MSKYIRKELSEILRNSNLRGQRIEVEGVARGIQEAVTLFGLNMPLGRRNYTAFLQDSADFILIQGDVDSYIRAMDELSMLRTSSETGEGVVVQGKITRQFLARLRGKYSPILKVEGVKFKDYASVGYKE